jgi:hypothetical protein
MRLRDAVTDNITLPELVLFVVDKVTSGEEFSMYFGFALLGSFHQHSRSSINDSIVK